MLILLGWGVYAEEIQSEEEVRQPCTYRRHSCPKSQLVKTVVYWCTLETLCTGLCSPSQTFISEEPAGRQWYAGVPWGPCARGCSGLQTFISEEPADRHRYAGVPWGPCALGCSGCHCLQSWQESAHCAPSVVGQLE